MRTYGRLNYVAAKPSFWLITDLSPHVAIAFKRLFTKAVKGAVEHRFTDTDDVRADLLWFMQRYPLVTDQEHELRAGAKRLEQRIAERDRILSPDWQVPVIKGFNAGYAPYPYQAQAAQICLNMKGLLLGDDVGLGKTITAAALLVMGAPLPAGIVVQAHLADQWAGKLREFTSLRVHVIRGTTPYTLPPADVYVYRYSNIAGWVDFLKNGLLKTIVYDEIQELRHGNDSDKGRAATIISARAKIRLGLTATPIYNYGDEMHTVMGYVMPNVLGTRDEFLREWTGHGKTVKDPDALGAYLRETGHYLRRDENDPSVDAAMPPPNVITTRVAWDAAAAADEVALMRALALSVTQGSFVEAGRAARELDSRMRHMTGVAKARAVAAMVRLILRGGAPRVLLAGWHHDVYSIWREALADYEPVSYNGTDSAAMKRFNIEAFTKGNSRVMMISLRSGVGLDGLQQYCRDTVIGEFDWSPQVHHQIIGRTRRPGQLHQVNVFYPYVDDGSDPVMMEVCGVKSDQARGISDPGAAPKLVVSDDSRIKRLAQFVLEGETAAPPPCELCDRASTGEPRHIIPLSEAGNYPAGAERDALYDAENVWFLCEACIAEETAVA